MCPDAKEVKRVCVYLSMLVRGKETLKWQMQHEPINNELFEPKAFPFPFHPLTFLTLHSLLPLSEIYKLKQKTVRQPTVPLSINMELNAY